jgi:phospholipase/carboxylesterase
MRGDWMDAPLRYDRSYVYRLHEPKQAPERTIVALHGSSTDETAILPMARTLDPNARIVAPRGRIIQNGERRWYRKMSPITFDQSSVRLEAEAFAGFLDGLRRDGVTDPERTLFIGYSNGANLLAAAMVLHPGKIRQAVLMRAMPVLATPPNADLTAARVLVLSGAADQTYGSYGAMLGDLLKRNGAAVVRDILSSGHEFGEADIVRARAWLDTIEGGVPATADAAPARG